MCFMIDDNATAPKQMTAWKVLVLSDGYLFSPFYPEKTGGRNWTEGKVIKRSKGDTRSWTGRSAASGVYVYLRKSAALSEARWHYICVVVEVAVDPRDWLHTSTCGSEATYDKVRVKVKQPYIDWY